MGTSNRGVYKLSAITVVFYTNGIVAAHTAGNSFHGDDWNIDFFVPVYASFHIPLSDKVNLRLNAGAYTGSGEYWNTGATATAAHSYKKL